MVVVVETLAEVAVETLAEVAVETLAEVAVETLAEVAVEVASLIVSVVIAKTAVEKAAVIRSQQLVCISLGS
jgi:hypothetical protein